MKMLIGVAVLFAIALFFIVAINKAKSNTATTGEDRYIAKPLLTENEKQWYRTIKDAVPHAHVFGQVAMNQLLNSTGEKRLSAYGKISARSIDFVVLNPELAVLIAIEIDDKSHNSQKRKVDDEKKSHALRQAGIALLRIPATPALPVDEVKKRIVETIATHARIQVVA